MHIVIIICFPTSAVQIRLVCWNNSSPLKRYTVIILQGRHYCLLCCPHVAKKTWHYDHNYVAFLAFICTNFLHVSFSLCTLLDLYTALQTTSKTWFSLVLFATTCRLEFQYGVCIPVSQLEGVCGRLCPALCLCRGGTHLHAWKSQVLPWGNGIFLDYNSQKNNNTETVAMSPFNTVQCEGAVPLSRRVHAYQFYIQHL